MNLKTAGLWKLNYNTIKSYTEDSITLSNNAVINFIKASSLNVGTDGSGNVFPTSNGVRVGSNSRDLWVNRYNDYLDGNRLIVQYRVFLGGANAQEDYMSIDVSDISGPAFNQGVAYANSLYTNYGVGTLYALTPFGVYVSVGSHHWYYK